LEIEQAHQGFLHLLEFIRRQGSQPDIEANERDGLDLLKMKRTRPEKGFGQGQLPTIAAQGGGVGMTMSKASSSSRG
jgi:hypothetical protein